MSLQVKTKMRVKLLFLHVVMILIRSSCLHVSKKSLLINPQVYSLFSNSKSLTIAQVSYFLFLVFKTVYRYCLIFCFVDMVHWYIVYLRSFD